MKNRLEAGEFIEAIELPLPAAKTEVRAYKISKRFDCDISAVCAALAIELDGGRIAAARLAFGGLAATVKRAARAEAALVGQAWNEATLATAQAALALDAGLTTRVFALHGLALGIAGGVGPRPPGEGQGEGGQHDPPAERGEHAEFEQLERNAQHADHQEPHREALRLCLETRETRCAGGRAALPTIATERL